MAATEPAKFITYSRPLDSTRDLVPAKRVETEAEETSVGYLHTRRGSLSFPPILVYCTTGDTVLHIRTL